MDGFKPSDVALNLQASVLAVIDTAFGAIDFTRRTVFQIDRRNVGS